MGERQRVEILKALLGDCRVLVLDEPTAVLVPADVDLLFASIRRLTAQGMAVVFISHKLHEVVDLADRISILRRGKAGGRPAGRGAGPGGDRRADGGAPTAAADGRGRGAGHRGGPGRRCPSRRRRRRWPTGRGPRPWRSSGLTLAGDPRPRVDDVSLTVRAGEIVGVAGVSGNGQTELVALLCGTTPVTAGTVHVGGSDVTRLDVAARLRAGLGRLTEDRRGSVVLGMSVEQNLVLEDLDRFRSGPFLSRRRVRAHAESLIERFDIRAAPADPIRSLSGGNMQKVLLARAIERDPTVLVASQPTRGLDVGACEYVYAQLRALREAGSGVLLVSEDLDELIGIADRIVVLSGGRLVGEVAAGRRDPRGARRADDRRHRGSTRHEVRAARPRAPLAGPGRRRRRRRCSRCVLTAGPIRLAGAAPVAAFERYLITPLTTANGMRRGAARRHPAAVHRAGRGRGLPGRLLQHRRRGAVPRRGDGDDRRRPARLPDLPAVAALPVGAGRRRAGRGGVGVPAGVPAPAVRHRRGGHDPAAQPGGGAAAAGAAERAVAQPRDRVPRLRALRRGLRDCRRCSAPGCTPGCCSGWCWSPSPPSSCWRTPLGVRLRAAGQSPAAARVLRRRRSGCCSGAARWSPARSPGSAAPSQVMGVQHQLTGSLAAGYGYTGVVVATLGGLSALGVLAVALLLGDVQVGAQNASITLQLPSQMGGVLTSVLLLTVVAALSVRHYRLVRRTPRSLPSGRGLTRGLPDHRGARRDPDHRHPAGVRRRSARCSASGPASSTSASRGRCTPVPSSASWSPRAPTRWRSATLAAVVAGALAGALMALLTVTLGVNQHVAGIGTTLLLVAACDFTNRLLFGGGERTRHREVLPLVLRRRDPRRSTR